MTKQPAKVFLTPRAIYNACPSTVSASSRRPSLVIRRCNGALLIGAVRIPHDLTGHASALDGSGDHPPCCSQSPK